MCRNKRLKYSRSEGFSDLVSHDSVLKLGLKKSFILGRQKKSVATLRNGKKEEEARVEENET